MYIVRSDENHVMAAYSNYLVMMHPGPEVLEAPISGSIGIVVQILCGLVVVALLLLTALCLLHQYTKQAHAQAVEMITFRTSLRLSINKYIQMYIFFKLTIALQKS